MKINVLIIVLLASLAIPSSIKNYLVSPGIDFYQFWGVSKAQELSNDKLKSPYDEHAKYAEVLTAYVDQLPNVRLKKANEHRHNGFDLTGTPLFYAIFALLPMNYTFAFGVYQILQIVLFIASVVMLGSMYNEDKSGLLSLALLLVLIYEPLLSDLRVGNFNSIQLFTLVLLIIFAERMARSAHNPLIPSAVFMCSLVFITLLKPNLSLVTLLLSVHLWALHGTRVFSIASAVSAVFCAFLVVVTSLKFNSWMVWLDWYNYLIGTDSAKLFYPVSQGNYATVLLVSSLFDKSNFVITVIIACALLFSAAIALIMSRSDKSNMKGIWQSTLRSLHNPHLIVALGVTATLILSPLAWFHYYLLSLIPAIWLLSARHHWRHCSKAGGLSVLLTSNVPSSLVVFLFGYVSIVPYGVASGLVPLWFGVLATLVYGQRDIEMKKSETSESDAHECIP
jgi:hypothetical protein